MLLGEITLDNWRNFSKRKQGFDKHNLIIGDNGVGKTNILEAIRFLSVGKSFRAGQTDEVVNFGAKFTRLQAKMEHEGKVKSIEFFYGQSIEGVMTPERQLLFGGKIVSWLDFFGKFPTVLFLPTDIEIVLGSPSSRRRFLDGTIWQIDPEYRLATLELGQILKERSAVLWQIKRGRADRDELAPWTQMLTKASIVIQERRERYLDFLNEQLHDLAKRINREMDVALAFLPNSLEISAVSEREIASGQNLIGAHRDDFKIMFRGRGARQFSSRGQARSIALLLRVSEAKYLASQLALNPIVLLDDILSELDEKTSRAFFPLLSGQVIATLTHRVGYLDDWKEILLP